VRLFRRRRKARQVALGAPAAIENSWGAPRALPPDVTAQLARLANLNGMGLITGSEYDAKKRQILGI
jgi:hypothetical protein